MPRRKTVTQETIEDLETPETESEIIDIPAEDVVEEEPEDIALGGLLAELRGSSEDAVVNVYRRGRGKHLGFMFATTPDEYTGGELMEKIRDEFGPGDYRVHIRKGKAIVANRPLSIAETVKKDDPTPQQNNSNDMLTFMIAQMNNQQQIFVETMRAFAETMKGGQQQHQGPDPIAMQTAMVQALVAMKGLVQDDNKGKDPSELLMDGIKLALEFAGPKGDTNSTDVLLEAVKTFAPTIAASAALPKHTNPPMVGPNGQQVNALSKPADPKAAADAEREKAMLMEKAYMKQQLLMLVNLAKAGKDPELYAEVLLDQLGEEKVLAFVRRDDALDELIKIEGTVASYKSWFIELRDAILRLTSDDDAADTDNMNGEGGTVAIQHVGSSSESSGDT